MQISLKLEDYLDYFRKMREKPLSMQLILKPFGLSYLGDPDPGFLAGTFMDYLAIEYNDQDWLDPIDIACAALDLGYEPAQNFLDEGPWLMVRATKKGHISMLSR